MKSLQQEEHIPTKGLGGSPCTNISAQYLITTTTPITQLNLPQWIRPH